MLRNRGFNRLTSRWNVCRYERFEQTGVVARLGTHPRIAGTEITQGTRLINSVVQCNIILLARQRESFLPVAVGIDSRRGRVSTTLSKLCFSDRLSNQSVSLEFLSVIHVSKVIEISG